LTFTTTSVVLTGKDITQTASMFLRDRIFPLSVHAVYFFLRESPSLHLVVMAFTTNVAHSRLLLSDCCVRTKRATSKWALKIMVIKRVMIPWPLSVSHLFLWQPLLSLSFEVHVIKLRGKYSNIVSFFEIWSQYHDDLSFVKTLMLKKINTINAFHLITIIHPLDVLLSFWKVFYFIFHRWRPV
jgi:hypothetical protein